MPQEHTIGEDDYDIRLDRWFKRHYPTVQHSLLEKQLRKGLVRLDGKKAKTSDRVLMGQKITIQDNAFTMQGENAAPSRPKRYLLTPEDVQFVQGLVIYKDSNIIVVNKPAGLAVQGGTKITRCLDDMLDGLTFDAKDRPKLTHRIDRDTSGVLVLARSSKIAAILSKAFAGKAIQKTYLALVNGSPMPSVGVVELALNKTARSDAYEQVEVDEEEGKYAKTEYRVIDSLARKYALVELKPLTGRMHQLRVHMAAIDCPIVGDYKYGGGMKQPKNSDAAALEVEDVLHLHAWKIEIPDLPGGKVVKVMAPLPKHMVHSFEMLGLDIPKGQNILKR